MPRSRLYRESIVDGQELINAAANKAGSLKALSDHIGYSYESLISIRANGLVSRKLEQRLIEFVDGNAETASAHVDRHQSNAGHP